LPACPCVACCRRRLGLPDIGRAAIGSRRDTGLLDSAYPRVKIEVHIALTLLCVVQTVAQNFELTAQTVKLALQGFHLIQQLDHAGRAIVRNRRTRRWSDRRRGRLRLSLGD
jgi:hypothetical protein